MVAEESYTGSIIVFPNQVFDWDVTSVDEVTGESLALVRAATPEVEVLLLGTGGDTGFLKPSIRQDIRDAAGLSVDFMDTGAACRTYNILLSEGRRVAAALIAV